mmetsp:Transcript_8881/g.24102  ORF Transcript_8881/g.24102 Transcript_8881/m.24102 type:complete len:595 (-) Transcript_8881:376-2160(-)
MWQVRAVVLALLLAMFHTATAIQEQVADRYETNYNTIFANEVTVTSNLRGGSFLMGGRQVKRGAPNVLFSAACDTLVCSSAGECSDEMRSLFFGYIENGTVAYSAVAMKEAVGNFTASNCTCHDYAEVTGRFCDQLVVSEEVEDTLVDECGVYNGDGTTCCPPLSARLGGSCVCDSGYGLVSKTLSLGGASKTVDMCCETMFDTLQCTVTGGKVDCICAMACTRGLEFDLATLSCRLRGCGAPRITGLVQMDKNTSMALAIAEGGASSSSFRMYMSTADPDYVYSIDVDNGVATTSEVMGTGTHDTFPSTGDALDVPIADAKGIAVTQSGILVVADTERTGLLRMDTSTGVVEPFSATSMPALSSTFVTYNEDRDEFYMVAADGTVFSVGNGVDGAASRIVFNTGACSSVFADGTVALNVGGGGGGGSGSNKVLAWSSATPDYLYIAGVECGGIVRYQFSNSRLYHVAGRYGAQAHGTAALPDNGVSAVSVGFYKVLAMGLNGIGDVFFSVSPFHRKYSRYYIKRTDSSELEMIGEGPGVVCDDCFFLSTSPFNTARLDNPRTFVQGPDGAMYFISGVRDVYRMEFPTLCPAVP